MREKEKKRKETRRRGKRIASIERGEHEPSANESWKKDRRRDRKTNNGIRDLSSNPAGEPELQLVQHGPGPERERLLEHEPRLAAVVAFGHGPWPIKERG